MTNKYCDHCLEDRGQNIELVHIKKGYSTTGIYICPQCNRDYIDTESKEEVELIERLCPKCFKLGHSNIMTIVHWNDYDGGVYVCEVCKHNLVVKPKEGISWQDIK
jgi:uncharacterized protein YbaR (Trm112 family)